MFYPLETSGRQQIDWAIAGLEVILFSLFLLINNRLSCAVCASALLLQLREKTNLFCCFKELKANIHPSSMLFIGFYEDIIWHSSHSWWKCSFSSRDCQMCAGYTAKSCSNSNHGYWILRKSFVLLVGTWMKSRELMYDTGKEDQ